SKNRRLATGVGGGKRQMLGVIRRREEQFILACAGLTHFLQIDLVSLVDESQSAPDWVDGSGLIAQRVIFDLIKLRGAIVEHTADFSGTVGGADECRIDLSLIIEPDTVFKGCLVTFQDRRRSNVVGPMG